MRPLVSVLMSCFNVEKYIESAITSLLEQSYQNIEFIFINDGSTDNTLDLMKTFKDQRIKLIDHENQGIVSSLNEGLGYCNGKYIARMDADDICKLDRIEKQVSFMEASPEVAACGGAINEFNGQGIIKKTSKPTTHIDLLFFSLSRAPISNPSAMIRRSVLIEHNIEYDPIYKYSEDVKFWFDIAKVAKLANLTDVLLEYRKSEGQVTTMHRSKQKSLANKARTEFYYFIQGNLLSLGELSNVHLKQYFKFMIKNDNKLNKKEKISAIACSNSNVINKVLLSLYAAVKG